MTITLRPYQQDMINRVREQYQLGNKSVLLQMPTGAGKTITAGWILKEVITKGKRAYFIVNRIELIEQTLIALEKLGLDCGVIASGLPELPSAAVQICSVDTLRSRIAKETHKPDFVIWDECRGIAAKGWQKVKSAFGDKAFHLGLDATPVRLDGKGLSAFFDALVIGLSIQELINMGSLVPPKVFSPNVKPDMSGVRKVAGDYKAEDVANAMGASAITGDIIEHYKRLGEDKQGLIFCPTVAYSKHIAHLFNEHDIACRHLDGGSSKHEREAIIEAYRAGEIKLLSNVGLFTAGFDVPNVSYIADASPTMSLANYLQRAGRGARPAEGKEYYILADHAGNAWEHGLPDDERSWSLEGRGRKGGEQDRFKKTVKECPHCSAISKVHKKTCHNCGHVFEVVAKQIEESTAELEQMQRLPKLSWAEVQSEVQAANSYSDFMAIARRQGYKKGWAWVNWQRKRQEMAQMLA